MRAIGAPASVPSASGFHVLLQALPLPFNPWMPGCLGRGPENERCRPGRHGRRQCLHFLPGELSYSLVAFEQSGAILLEAKLPPGAGKDDGEIGHIVAVPEIIEVDQAGQLAIKEDVAERWIAVDQTVASAVRSDGDLSGFKCLPRIFEFGAKIAFDVVPAPDDHRSFTVATGTYEPCGRPPPGGELVEPCQHGAQPGIVPSRLVMLHGLTREPRTHRYANRACSRVRWRHPDHAATASSQGPRRGKATLGESFEEQEFGLDG